ncbi:hypothetical protein G7070_06895 [Propioniciclava coleopterorum]|uniref:Uncharacterized protein n=1 Tax=Propioniciclava coleopterorum TaxID=2714937 RepID=A0A6G7Y581_9ACTN|nr:hypothetical protein [Propioniciclava coleopterorum]QIK72044.1 hypothetical protein G7070_06895 [Propioniciclava coleopterorum]
MSGNFGAIIIVGLIVLVVLAAVLFLASKRANRRTPVDASRQAPPISGGAPAAPASRGDAGGVEADSWSSAIAEAADARPDAVDQPRTFFSRDSLVDRDRSLDTSRWDNRPDGSEEYDEGEAPRGGSSIDAGFIQSLRERDKNA